jgi:hypothetical protein
MKKLYTPIQISELSSEPNSTPDSGYNFLYFKSDGLYYKTPGDVEYPVSSTGGTIDAYTKTESDNNFLSGNTTVSDIGGYTTSEIDGLSNLTNFYNITQTDANFLTGTTTVSDIGGYTTTQIDNNFLSGDSMQHISTDAGNVIINEDGIDVDFRIEGLTNAVLFRTNAATDSISIGNVIDAAAVLSITGDVTMWNDLQVNNIRVQNSISHDLDTDTFINFGTNLIYFYAGDATYEKLKISSTEVVINEDSQDIDFRVESSNNANAIFLDSGVDLLNINVTIKNLNASGLTITTPNSTQSYGQSGPYHPSTGITLNIGDGNSEGATPYNGSDGGDFIINLGTGGNGGSGNVLGPGGGGDASPVSFNAGAGGNGGDCTESFMNGGLGGDGTQINIGEGGDGGNGGNTYYEFTSPGVGGVGTQIHLFGGVGGDGGDYIYAGGTGGAGGIGGSITLWPSAGGTGGAGTGSAGADGADGKVEIKSSGSDPLLLVNGNVEADGYSPFTGLHRFITDNSAITSGDSVFLSGNTFVYITNDSYMTNSIGIVSEIRRIRSGDKISMNYDITSYLPIILTGITTGITLSGETGSTETSEETNIYYIVSVAAVGDSIIPDKLGGFRVCDENGYISGGTLLVTSSTPGYLMAQSDNIIKSHTIGKSMFDVTFDGNGKSIDIYGVIYCG